MATAGEHIFIIGGTSGLGHALAEAACQAGANVTIAGRGADRAAQAAAALGPLARGVHLDLEDLGSIAAAFEGAGRIDHLVLTPVYPGAQTIRAFDAREAARAMQVKLVGFAEAVHRALPCLQPSSSIVLFGGLAKDRPYPGSTTVSIANGGILGMVNTLAVELAPVRVNAVVPGVVGDSPRWQQRVQAGGAPAAAAMEAARKRTPSARLTTVEDVVDGAFFLMRNRAANAIELVLDGGVRLA